MCHRDVWKPEERAQYLAFERDVLVRALGYALELAPGHRERLERYVQSHGLRPLERIAAPIPNLQDDEHDRGMRLLLEMWERASKTELETGPPNLLEVAYDLRASYRQCVAERDAWRETAIAYRNAVGPQITSSEIDDARMKLRDTLGFEPETMRRTS